MFTSTLEGECRTFLAFGQCREMHPGLQIQHYPCAVDVNTPQRECFTYSNVLEYKDN